MLLEKGGVKYFTASYFVFFSDIKTEICISVLKKIVIVANKIKNIINQKSQLIINQIKKNIKFNPITVK